MGIEFRSRLEAFWAKKFQDQELDWQYEPLSILLHSGDIYTPDFKIRSCGVEIKPTIYHVEQQLINKSIFTIKENYFSSFKVLIGNPFDNPFVDGEHHSCAELFFSDGFILIEVRNKYSGFRCDFFKGDKTSKFEFVDFKRKMITKYISYMYDDSYELLRDIFKEDLLKNFNTFL